LKKYIPPVSSEAGEAFEALLEACQSAVRLLRGSGFTEGTPTLTQLRIAITLAEGVKKGVQDNETSDENVAEKDNGSDGRTEDKIGERADK